MSDYAISIRVRNARIKRKIAECGFRNVNELCRRAGLSPSAIGALLNLKVRPLTQTGAWRRSAVALAEVLGCTCEDLFSVTQRTLALRTNQTERTVTENELLKLCHRIEQPLLDNPEERLLEDSDEHTKGVVIRRALDALKLTARNRKIIESYFGFSCEERTLNDLALEFSVSRAAIENSLNRTLQRLGKRESSSHRLLLQAYQPVNAMGKADEARIESAQQRAALIRIERHHESLVRAQRAAPTGTPIAPAIARYDPAPRRRLGSSIEPRLSRSA
jgi:hypothetical protein